MLVWSFQLICIQYEIYSLFLNFTDSSFPTQYHSLSIYDDNSAQGNTNRVAVGYYFYLWLDNKGKLYSAGKCENGALGTGCTGNQTTAVTVMTGVKDIKVHPRNQIACALKIDNTLHCWGENNANEITSAHANNIETPLQIATNVAHFGVFGVRRNMLSEDV